MNTLWLVDSIFNDLNEDDRDALARIVVEEMVKAKLASAEYPPCSASDGRNPRPRNCGRDRQIKAEAVAARQDMPPLPYVQ